MPAKRDYSADELLGRIEEQRELARVRVARWRARQRGTALPRTHPWSPSRMSTPPRVVRVVESCVVCGFSLTDRHHVWGRTEGDEIDNLTVLCPNHHRMVHEGRLSMLAHAALSWAPFWPAWVGVSDDAGETGVDGPGTREPS